MGILQDLSRETLEEEELGLMELIIIMMDMSEFNLLRIKYLVFDIFIGVLHLCHHLAMLFRSWLRIFAITLACFGGPVMYRWPSSEYFVLQFWSFLIISLILNVNVTAALLLPWHDLCWDCDGPFESCLLLLWLCECKMFQTMLRHLPLKTSFMELIDNALMDARGHQKHLLGKSEL